MPSRLHVVRTGPTYMASDLHTIHVRSVADFHLQRANTTRKHWRQIENSLVDDWHAKIKNIRRALEANRELSRKRLASLDQEHSQNIGAGLKQVMTKSRCTSGAIAPIGQHTPLHLIAALASALHSKGLARASSRCASGANAPSERPDGQNATVHMSTTCLLTVCDHSLIFECEKESQWPKALKGRMTELRLVRNKSRDLLTDSVRSLAD